MVFSENIVLAFRAVRTNMLRAVLTMLIIVVGIAALVGILTALDALLFTMTDNFSRMGANAFSISPAGQSLQSHQDGRQQKRGEPITFRQAMEFKDRYDFPAQVSVNARATGNAVVRYKEEKTNPTVRVQGIDDNYLEVNGYAIGAGRGFTRTELETGSQKAIVGFEIVELLFATKPEAALDKVITVGSHKFRIIGTLESKGASLNQSEDRQVFIPLFAERRFYGYADKNYNIGVAVPTSLDIDDAISTATGVMRNIRSLRASQDNDFEMFKSTGLLEILKENTAGIRFITITIGLITLLGAAIGLMNIMLVSVTERIREIGISKALGATRRNIMMQFMTEAVLICQVGGVIGIVCGIIIGNLVARLVGGSFLIPWAWILLGFVTCLIVGMVAGIYPALKAARLDPIESLRYE